MYRLNGACFRSESSTVLRAVGTVVPQNQETYGNSMDEKMGSDVSSAWLHPRSREAMLELIRGIAGQIRGKFRIEFDRPRAR